MLELPELPDYPVCRFCNTKKTYHGPECMQEWIAWAQGQVPPHRNQHTVTALIGERGSGKTGGGLCIFSLVQEKPFNVREQVYFRPSDRVAVSRRLGEGYVVYGDESSGEGGNSRRAMSEKNVVNIMDIDTMRHRHQHTVFTCPEWKSLDSGIRNAVDWVHKFDKSHTITTYEHIRPSNPNGYFDPWLKERFITTDAPHAEFTNPEMWAELLSMKDDYLAGRDNKHQEAMRAREEKMANIMLGVLQPKPKGEDSSGR